jgi:hypothetical protein
MRTRIFVTSAAMWRSSPNRISQTSLEPGRGSDRENGLAAILEMMHDVFSK